MYTKPTALLSELTRRKNHYCTDITPAKPRLKGNEIHIKGIKLDMSTAANPDTIQINKGKGKKINALCSRGRAYCCWRYIACSCWPGGSSKIKGPAGCFGYGGRP